MKTAKELKNLVRPSNMFRDPIQGDIALTTLEKKIIDTNPFQRLRRIKQLGCTSLVYSGATHTRFSHALGTVQSAQRIVDQINKDPSNYSKLGTYHILLVRLCALLHDLPHIPFGHTLEDEGSLFPSQWEDIDRVHYYLGKESEIGNIIVNEVGDQCRTDIVRILTAKNESDFMTLPYPFIADIVGDTLCADLLDYSRRDSYFAGLVGGYVDERIIQHLSINKTDGPFFNRMVLRLSDTKGKVRVDIVGGVLDLLRSRYRIMEQIIFHHTKIAASAMIIDAVYDSLRENKLSKNELFQLGDDELLFVLETHGTQISKDIIAKLRRRLLYKPVYMVPFFLRDERLSIKKRQTEIFDRFRHPQRRWELERELETTNSLPPGSIILYCPKIEKSEKSTTLRVMIGNKIMPLKDIPLLPAREEIDTLERFYKYLPKFYVFIDPAQYQKGLVMKIVSSCESIFEMKNCLYESS
ncbi:MAG: HD domain-containing protein [Candidatus Thermoplasmatota archaeon]